jgi:hypothetical protein
MAGPSSVPVFERFFRSVAQLKVDKSDVKRFREFVDGMVDDIAIAGRNSARARSGRHRSDGPADHEGLQERMREFDKLDEAADIRAVLAEAVRRPPADVTFSEETEEMLPEVFGGLGIAVARAFRTVDPDVVNPATEHWDRVTDLFRQVY